MLGKKQLLIVIAAFAALVLSGCSKTSDWARRDFPTDGLTQAVEYRLQGVATSEELVNESRMRGVNEIAPQRQQLVEFRQMSGLKTEDVQITLPNGQPTLALNMAKIQRFAGLTKFMDLEGATYSGVDSKGNVICAARIRLQFTRNLVQYADPSLRDYDTLWMYDVPCSRDNFDFHLDLSSAKLRALVLNEVWQARVAAASIFWNWGHSVTVVGGPATTLTGGWWTNWETSDGNDVNHAAKLVNAMIADLSGNDQPWLEFKDPVYRDATVIFSAGDADKYATLDRALLNRQTEWLVAYRPGKETSWDYVRIQPLYNWEWNLVVRDLANLSSWGSDPLSDQLNEVGIPKDIDNAKVQALERVGFANAPNPTLSQVRFIDAQDHVLYAITIRAFIGAADSLVLYTRTLPGNVAQYQDKAPQLTMPRPISYDKNGNPLSEDQQPIKADQWPQYLREMSLWQYVKDPRNFQADLKLQYRFRDNTTWKQILCTDTNHHEYVCGYSPVEWKFNSSYLWQGDVHTAWLITQLLGEVGVRTLGFSYASGPFQGTGILFAQAQGVLRDKFISGYTTPEDLLVLDCRACQYPDTLEDAWNTIHNK
jgi:hypothetical protein